MFDANERGLEQMEVSFNPWSFVIKRNSLFDGTVVVGHIGGKQTPAHLMRRGSNSFFIPNHSGNLIVYRCYRALFSVLSTRFSTNIF